MMDSPARDFRDDRTSPDPFQVTATTPDEADRVTGFLSSIFQAPLDARFISPGIFHWKYFAKRPDWDQPRSYVLKEDDALVAHIGVWPTRFRGPSGELTGMHTLDWAANRERPGTGSRLRLEVEELADFGIGIGGSVAAQMARAKLGYRTWRQMSILVRVVRPRLKFRSTSGGSQLRRFGRLGRDLVHAARSFSAARSGLSAQVVESFDDSLDKVASLAERGEVRAYRTAAVLNYFLSCPDANGIGIVFCDRSTLCGYGLLTRLGGQARIAALWVRGDWESAYQLATEIAAKDPNVYEMIAGASSAREELALVRNGYRVRNVKSVDIRDARGMIRSGSAPCVQLADSDAFFL